MINEQFAYLTVYPQRSASFSHSTWGGPNTRALDGKED